MNIIPCTDQKMKVKLKFMDRYKDKQTDGQISNFMSQISLMGHKKKRSENSIKNETTCPNYCNAKSVMLICLTALPYLMNFL